MPYITTDKRTLIDLSLKQIEQDIFSGKIDNVGELNYIITHILHTFIEKKPWSYSNFNSIIGVLECIKQEYYRRIIVKYEEKKIEENGDIYDEDDGLALN